MQPGNLLLLMYSETGEQKYRVAATQIRTRINGYPRTQDGSYWHSSTEDYKKHDGDHNWDYWKVHLEDSLVFLRIHCDNFQK